MEGYWYKFKFENGQTVAVPQLGVDATVKIPIRYYVHAVARIGDESKFKEGDWLALEEESFRDFQCPYSVYMEEIDAQRANTFKIKIGKTFVIVNQAGELVDKKAINLLELVLGRIDQPFIT